MRDLVTLEERDGIALLTICDPPRNELTIACFAALARCVRERVPRLAASGLIVSGAGRHFSSGANVAELKERLLSDGEAAGRLVREHRDALDTLEALPIPVVAAVSGTCLGAALELALACHFRVATRRAALALPEVSFGLMPGLGGAVRLARLVGASRAMELVLTGRTLLAEEALAMGLVDAVVDRGDLLDQARAMIELAAARGAGVGSR